MVCVHTIRSGCQCEQLETAQDALRDADAARDHELHWRAEVWEPVLLRYVPGLALNLERRGPLEAVHQHNWNDDHSKRERRHHKYQEQPTEECHRITWTNGVRQKHCVLERAGVAVVGRVEKSHEIWAEIDDDIKRERGTNLKKAVTSQILGIPSNTSSSSNTRVTGTVEYR
jgi:hypothetical protein